VQKLRHVHKFHYISSGGTDGDRRIRSRQPLFSCSVVNLLPISRGTWVQWCLCT